MGWLFFQREIVQALVSFLKAKLPLIGGDGWWETYVLNQLSPYQAHRLGIQKNLGSLDLAALLSVALASCDELIVNGHARREYSDLLHKLKRTRNRHAHAPADGYKPAVEAKDLEDSALFVGIIGCETDLVSRLRAAASTLKALMSQAASGNATEQSAHGLALAATYFPLRSPQPSSPDKSLERRTYLGMDFGTSTTVVSAASQANGEEQLSPLVLDQPDQFGVPTRSHMVNSVIAYLNGRLVFGREAYRQRSLLHEGRNVFSSFKMRLGIDLGPSYPETAVRSGVLNSGLKIESAQDAARVFFQFILGASGKALAAAKLPESTNWCVSVPASFEANQRRDLEDALQAAGIATGSVPLIDEPNAAFLSYLYESARSENSNRILDLLRERPVNVMVYDFGAGTCDVSVLRLEIGAGGVESRNLAVSRFTALGGDDIDLALARQVLLPQLTEETQNPSQRDIEERLLPRLQPTAELLKIRLLEHAQDKGINTLSGLREAKDLRVTAQDIEAFTIGSDRYELCNPNASLAELASAMEPFVKLPAPHDDRLPHVFAPVRDALEKSGKSAEDLDGVLFIGGSSENPIARETVMKGLGGGVEAIVPSDLRSHVSKGAALHSYWFSGCGFDFIQPITSEPILALARGAAFEAIVPASTPLPTKVTFSDDLYVEVEGQRRIEIPICVSSADKLLGVITIDCPDPAGFRHGTKVQLTASVTREKILEVTAQIGNSIAKTTLLNPMANRALTQTEKKLLKAKQAFNEALLNNRGRPPVGAVVAFAKASEAAGDHRQAAEMYQKAEQLDPKRNFATSITFNYSRAGERNLAKLWAQKAYEREPSAVSAYNLAVNEPDESEKERLLREALDLESEYHPAMEVLGRMLSKNGNPEGEQLLEKCADDLSERLQDHRLNESESRTLARIARELGKTHLAQQAEARSKSLESGENSPSAYVEENLLGHLRAGLLVTDK